MSWQSHLILLDFSVLFLYRSSMARLSDIPDYYISIADEDDNDPTEVKALMLPLQERQITPATAECIDYLSHVADVLINRGQQYGESAFMPGRFGISAEQKCLARLSEKLDRFDAHLTMGTDDTDTIDDIIGYFTILKVIRNRLKGQCNV